MLSILFLWSVCFSILYVLIRSRFPPQPKIRISPPRRKHAV